MASPHWPVAHRLRPRAKVLPTAFASALAVGGAVAVTSGREVSRWHAEAEAFARTGRTKEAEAYYRLALEGSPSDAVALNNLGAAVRGRGGLHEAESLYALARQADPSLGAAWANLGQAMLSRGAAAESVPFLRRGIELGHPSLHQLLGHALLATHDHGVKAEAEFSFREAARFAGPTSGTSAPDSSSSRSGAASSSGRSPRAARRAGALLDPDLTAVTVATRTDEAGLEMLLHSAEAAGVPIWVRGADANTLRSWGTRAGGWGIKLRLLKDAARRARSPDSLILWIDAYDVVFSPTSSAKRIRQRFESFGRPVVLAAEGHCVPEQGNCVGKGGDTNGKAYPLQPYLNSGVLMARAGVLLDILERYPFEDPVDDQAYFGRIWQRERGRVVIDSARQLFACPFQAINAAGAIYALSGASWPSGPPAFGEIMLRHDGTIQAVDAEGTAHAEPLLLHFNGPARTLMEPAYRALFPGSVRGSQAPSAGDWRQASSANAKAPAAATAASATPRLLGTGLREGPWRCSPDLVESESQAALCQDGEVLVDQVFVANLDRRTDRLLEIDAELRRHGLRAVRFPAIDGNSIAKAEQERHDKSALRGIPKGHLGCFFTHLAMWREVRHRAWPVALMLEDDAAAVEEQIASLPARIHELRTIDPAWHFAYLGRNPVEVSRALLMNEGILSNWPARRDRRVTENIMDPGTSEGLWAYLLSAQGASVLVPVFDGMVSAGVTYDVDLSLHFDSPRKALRMYAVEPPLFRQREADGFSDTSQVARGRKQLLLGHQFMQAGKYAEAETRLRQALLETQAGGQDADLWIQEMQRYLAASVARQSNSVGDHRALEAEDLFRKALALAAKDGSAAEKALAGTASDLCHFISTQGRFAEAHGLCKRALRVAEKTGRKEDACAAHGYLGILFDLAGKHGEAEAYFRRAVSVGEEGVRHSRLCTDLANLCTFLRQRGRHSEAEEPCSRCPAVVDVKAAHDEL